MQDGLSFSRLYASILAQGMENGEGLPCPAVSRCIQFTERSRGDQRKQGEVRALSVRVPWLPRGWKPDGNLLEAFSSDAIG